MDQLQKQLDNNEFQEIGSMALLKTTEEKVDSSKALDASLVIIERNGTESQEQDTSSRSGNDAHVDDADIRPIFDEEPMAEYGKLLAENEQLHKEKEHLKQTYKDLFDSIKRTRVQTKNQNDSLMEQLNKKSNENADVLAQIQKKGFAIAALKNELRKLTGNSVNTKFAKPSILGKPVGQPLKNQSVVRQPTAFKSERPRISKPRFASQVDVNNDLSKPVTTHHLPKGRESALAKPHHMIAPSSSRYSSNDIVHNHYLEEAKKKTHEHSRIPRNFSDSKHFVCSTCQKCVFNANHDACVIKFLKEVNSRAKVPSNKTTNRNKPVEQIRVATKPKRQIPKGHRFSIKKTTTVHEKTTSPRSCLRWQPTGRILKTVCLRWVPTGKIFAFSTNKVDSEPPNGSKEDITNQCESEQALDVSAGTLLSTVQASFFIKMTSDHNRSELGIHDHSNEPSKLVLKVVPLAVKTTTLRQELELLFHHHIAMLRTTGVNHYTSVSRPQLKCYQVKDKVMPNNSQVKFKKKEVEDHHRISSISKKTKSVTAYLNDVKARTKKPNVVPISASKPKRKANKSVATPHKKTVASDTTIQKSKSYHKELYENTNQEWKWWIAKRCPSGYKWTQKPLRTKKIWMPSNQECGCFNNVLVTTIDMSLGLLCLEEIKFLRIQSVQWSMSSNALAVLYNSSLFICGSNGGGQDKGKKYHSGDVDDIQDTLGLFF
ncbi:hypothetical protein Tco_0500609 [Tanacetum coccineum]